MAKKYNIDAIMEYHIESNWLGGWYVVRSAATPKRALEIYYEVQKSRAREAVIAEREGKPICQDRPLRIRKNDGVIMVQAK